MKLFSCQTKIGWSFLVVFLFIISIDLSGQTESVNPYPQLLFPNFAKGIIKMKSGKINSATLNYNTIDEEMIFDQKGVYMVLDNPNEIDTVFLQSRKFIPFEKAFYEVLTTGPVSMFIQHKYRWAPVATKTAYGLTSQTNATTIVTTMKSGNQVRSLEVPENVTVSSAIVYWVRVKNEMHKFNTERQFIKIFPEKENELKEFIKNSKLDLKSREDLIRLGNQCNMLVK